MWVRYTWGVSFQLPRWVVTDAESARNTARDYRGLSPEERARETVLACSAAARLLRANPKRDLVLALVDPLPETTVRGDDG